MLAPNIAFAVIAVVMLFAGVRLVTVGNVVHAALYLLLVLAGTAAIFILLGAEFVGWTQVLVYIGAIVVLFMFGVMLTKAQTVANPDDPETRLDSKPSQRIFGGIVALAILALLVAAFVTVFDGAEIFLEGPVGLKPTTAAQIGEDLFARWVLPFEAISLVLLAALIGAVVLARRDDPEHVQARSGSPSPESAPIVAPDRPPLVTTGPKEAAQ